MTHIVQLKPEGRYVSSDLERLVNEIKDLAEYPEVMHQQVAANFLGISYSKIRRMEIPSHKLPGLVGRIYLKSELLDFIKKH
jgi:hypothetical protein